MGAEWLKLLKTDMLLQRKYEYRLTGSSGETKMKFTRMLHGKWTDLSNGYYGTLEGDGTFTFKQKFVFFIVLRSGQPVYLERRFEKLMLEKNYQQCAPFHGCH